MSSNSSANDLKSPPSASSASASASAAAAAAAPRSSSPTKRGPTLEQLASKLKLGSGGTANAEPTSAGVTGSSTGASEPLSPPVDSAGAGAPASRGRLGLAGRLAVAQEGGEDEDALSKSPKKADGSTLFTLDAIRDRLTRKGLPHSRSQTGISGSGGSGAAAADDAKDSAAEEKSVGTPAAATVPTTALSPPQTAISTTATVGTVTEASTPIAVPRSQVQAQSQQQQQQQQPAAAPQVAVAPKPASAGGPTATTPQVGADGKKVHPLQHKWTLYFDSKSWNPSNAGQGQSQHSTPANTPQMGATTGAGASSGSRPGSTPQLPYPTTLPPGASSTSSSSVGVPIPASPLSPVTPAPGASSLHAPNTWEAALKMLGAYTTVEAFFGTFSTLRRPSGLEKNSNYHLFKDGIKPMWEDRRNANGGKWTLTFKGNQNPALFDRSWMWLVLALIGQELDPDNLLTGAVVSTRAKGDRLSIWTRNKEEVDSLNALARRFVGILDLEKEPGVGLEFSYNTGQPLPQPNGFWSFYNPPGHSGGGGGGHAGAPAGRHQHQHQHQQHGPPQGGGGGFGSSPALKPTAATFSPPTGSAQGGVGGSSSTGAGGRFSNGVASSGTGVLKRGGENPFVGSSGSASGSAAFGSSPSKSSSSLAPPSLGDGPRPVMGSASPIKRNVALP